MKSRSSAHVPRHAAAPPAPVDDAAASHTTRRVATTVAATLGAAAAVTTLAAPSAQAQSRYHTWDRVANCESGNRWHVNTGNGFYGGLQFTTSTWSSYGGGKYASRADRASRMEQIQVARRVLHSQGPNAWPVCSGHAGLNRANGQATGKRLPADADGDGRSDMHGRSVQHHATTQHKAKHRSHAQSQNVHHRARHASHGTYRVHSGDTLAKIAAKKHVAGGWRALYRVNRDRVHNPNSIHVGQVLRLP